MTEGLDLRLEDLAGRAGSGAGSAAARPAVAGRTPAGTPIRVDADSLACMGLWGFFPEILPLLAERFRAFLAASPGADDEFYLSEAVSHLAAAGRARCGLLRAGEGWMGLTFPGDRAGAAASLRQLTEAGAYPADLRPPRVRPEPARRAQAPPARPPRAPPRGVRDRSRPHQPDRRAPRLQRPVRAADGARSTRPPGL